MHPRALRGRSWSRHTCSTGASRPISLPRGTSRPLCSAVRLPWSTARRALSVPAGTRSCPASRDRRASLEARPLGGDQRASRAVVRVHTHAPRISPTVGAAHGRSPPSGCPRSARRLAVAAFAAAILVTVVIASQSGTRHSSSERKVRAAGLLGASGTDALSASSNPLVQRAAQHDRAPHHVRPIHPRRTTRAHRRPHRATKHVVVAARYTPSTSSTASYTPSSTSSSSRARAPRRCPRSPREAPRRAARARAAAARRLVNTESSAPAGAPPTLSKETPSQCSRP